MIERYSDHAANERTFLAWVRTAIAIMTFGFFVEKFDLFIAFSSAAAGGRIPLPSHPMIGNVTGLLLIALGGVTMAVAALRFRRTASEIDSEEVVAGGGERIDLALAGLLALLGATLLVYLGYSVLSWV